MYGVFLPNLAEVTTRYDFWKNEEQSDESLQKLLYEDLISRALPFYPSVAEAIKIGWTLPATTAHLAHCSR